MRTLIGAAEPEPHGSAGPSITWGTPGSNTTAVIPSVAFAPGCELPRHFMPLAGQPGRAIDEGE
jgi:hypothetical protein